MREYVYNYKRKMKCSDCGESDPCVLAFDHDDPSEKFASVSRMVSKGYSEDKVKKEISKCTVRCHNCHARKTAREQGWYSWLKKRSVSGAKEAEKSNS